MIKVRKEIQENTVEQVEVFKEEIGKYREIQKNKIKQVEEMNKTVQDLRMEIEAVKKTQTERILEMENPGKRIGTTDACQQNIRNGRENLSQAPKIHWRKKMLGLK